MLPSIGGALGGLTAKDIMDWLVAVSTAAAAAFAGVQIKMTRSDSQTRTAIELINDVRKQLNALRSVDLHQAREEALRAYRGEAGITERAVQYLAYLDSLESAASVAQQKMADQKLLDAQLPTLTGTAPREFLAALQECCGDPEVYRPLSDYLRRHDGRLQKAAPAVISTKPQQLIANSMAEKKAPSQQPPAPKPQPSPRPSSPPPQRPVRKISETEERGFPPPPPPPNRGDRD